MTREEAIQMLDNIKHEEAGRAIGKDGFYAELMGYHVQALEMAIQALSQEPCDDCVHNHTSICGNCKNYDEYEPCTDAVSREAVLDLAKKGILVSNGNYKNVCKAINELPSVSTTKNIVNHGTMNITL